MQSSNVPLREFIDHCQTRLKLILDRLQWSEEDTLKNFNTNSVASFDTVVPKRVGSPNIATYPDSCISNNSIVLGSSKLQEILQKNAVKAPRSFRELQENFSRLEKLKIYEHVVENTKKLENNIVENVTEGEISLADILAQKKQEEKRRKRRFRKSKPTHTEEVRGLIDLQMQALEQFMGNKTAKQQLLPQYATTKSYSLREEDKGKHEDYYVRKANRELNENHIKSYKSRYSGPRDRHKNKRYKRSSSRESKYSRKRRSRSRSKHRRKLSESPRHRSRSKSHEYRNAELSRKHRKKNKSRDISRKKKSTRIRSNERRDRNYKE